MGRPDGASNEWPKGKNEERGVRVIRVGCDPSSPFEKQKILPFSPTVAHLPLNLVRSSPPSSPFSFHHLPPFFEWRLHNHSSSSFAYLQIDIRKPSSSIIPPSRSHLKACVLRFHLYAQKPDGNIDRRMRKSLPTRVTLAVLHTRDEKVMRSPVNSSYDAITVQSCDAKL
ncbi:unnamed protein product [Vicia faba]|uniref:Uncharacterized protein n=1 Tax=Vicia faba TaxID=3906 RepID=A0AAV0Z7C9_VICFA|nr:unnamed protein product [Vicia faba]